MILALLDDHVALHVDIRGWRLLRIIWLYLGDFRLHRLVGEFFFQCLTFQRYRWRVDEVCHSGEGFDETAGYWGSSFDKIILAGNNRLSVRSVKIFADGAFLLGGVHAFHIRAPLSH